MRRIRDASTRPSLAPHRLRPLRPTEVRPGERVVLKRRKDYWAEDLPIRAASTTSTKSATISIATPTRCSRPSRPGFMTIGSRAIPDAGRRGTISGGQERPHPSGRPSRSASQGDERLRLQHAPAAVLGHPGPRGPRLLFDFDWVNRNLFSAVLTRSDSFFAGSDLSSARQARGRTGARGCSRPFPGRRPSGHPGRPLGASLRAMDPAGTGIWPAGAWRSWPRRAGCSTATCFASKATGEPFAFEMLVNSRQQERLALNYAQSPDAGSASRRGCGSSTTCSTGGDSPVSSSTWSSGPGRHAVPRQRAAQPLGLGCGANGWARSTTPASHRRRSTRLIDALLAARAARISSAAVRALDRALLSGFYVVPAVLSERSMACL